MSWKKLITSGSLAELNGLTTTANITLSNASIVGDTTSTPLLKVDTDQFAFVSSFDEDAGLSFANIGGDPYFAFTNFSQTPIIKLGVNNNSYTFVGAISASIFSGSFVGDGSGLTNLPGGGGGSDTDWYDSATGYITTSNDVHITGSLYVSGSQENTGSLYISGSIENVHYVDFDINQSEDLTYKNGRLFYNTNEGALTFYNEESDIGLQIGQEFYVRVFNDSDSVIQNGTPVYVSGAQGDRPKVWTASAEPHYEHNPTENHILGLATHDIQANSEGYVTELGIVRNIDVGAGWVAGDTIYVSSSGGELTNIRPEYPYEKIEVGILVRHTPPKNGFIFVKPESPTHFENISELSASTPYINGQVFVYNESAQGWTNTNELTNITASSIIASGSFSGSFVGDGSGLTGVGGGGGSDTDWYEGAGFITSSNDVQITGSLSITGSRLTSNPVSLSISSNTASLDCTDGNFYTLTLASSADTHLDITNPVGGQTINVKITQPATVGTISFSSNVKFAGGIAYSASAVANAVDIISLITFDSTDVFLTSIKDFS